MDVGLELQRARERRGLSLQQLSQITKIRPHVLEAIEASEEARLPAPVFTRSFVRTYAAEVRLDPDDTLRRYLEQFEPVPAPEDTDTATAPEPERSPPPTASARVLRGTFGTVAVLILAAVTAVALAGRHDTSAQSEQASPPQTSVAAAGVAPVAAAQPEAVGTSGTAANLHLTIAPTGPCWVRAMAGDAQLLAAELNAGDRRTVEAPSDITLRIGDPATFAFSINGRQAKVPGAAGQAVTVRVTSANYTQFLAAR